MFTSEEITKVLKVSPGIKPIRINGISTDTRTLKSGDLFIPLKGENFDGHDYIPQAVKKGAALILASKKLSKPPKHVPIIYVRDTLEALQALAGAYLQKFNLPVVAITGSSGKTTTKDMMASVLAQKYKVLMNEGNLRCPSSNHHFIQIGSEQEAEIQGINS
jgi:UDP-N-acetylmuramoyl-tripeptide--D-alanyl-D-alanine ligase